MNKILGHLKTITKHKWHVFNACRKSGIVWRGIKHDMSKFSPAEFFIGVKYFDGTKSPNAFEKELFGYSTAWLHHRGRNSHHWDHWTDFRKGELIILKMPINDVKELLCDWIGAGKVYNKNEWNHEEAGDYYYNRRTTMLFHPETRELIEEALTVLKLEGEKSFYKYVKKLAYGIDLLVYGEARTGISRYVKQEDLYEK